MHFPKTTQEDHVKEDLYNRKVERVTKLNMPGIKTLHTRPLPEIAAALAAALKSTPDIKELRYVVGQYIEITQTDPE